MRSRAPATKSRQATDGRRGVTVFRRMRQDLVVTDILMPAHPKVRFASDSPLEGDGFEPVWGFSCQVVIFGLLAVLCSERESRSSSRRLRSGSRSARKGSRDRNGSTAWRLAAQ